MDSVKPGRFTCRECQRLVPIMPGRSPGTWIFVNHTRTLGSPEPCWGAGGDALLDGRGSFARATALRS
jgi:hypothetical protein